MANSLTNPQQLSFEKLFTKGSSPQDRKLSHDLVRSLIFITAEDLDIDLGYNEVPIPKVYSTSLFDELSFLPELDTKDLYSKLLGLNPNAETYVTCLAQVVRARLKFERVLKTQPLSTMEQVGPRSLLQFGSIDNEALASLLVWRKWLYDIDNRAAQDTGYLFEPVIAGAIGGIPYGHKNSPIRRSSGKGGRQVDAIKGAYAYELKIRITIAASGQGRWSEELSFPEECIKSGYTPVLVVLNSTDNPKLREIVAKYQTAGGQAYTGEDAWQHLRDEAGAEMGVSLKKYVELPLKTMVQQENSRTVLLPLGLSQEPFGISIDVGGSSMRISHGDFAPLEDEADIPENAADFLPGN
ncbi:hypothetical protein KJY77_01015 [Canibacter sp. lx-72]|uniref:hypothetical protein n=1 Tax=Canibacter zhuwentaonis TaxID=2837491 RepID=UPI001BDBF410|nr:hypothetical protein [Canibacter zhuwentaonis]MBT1017724.1 hypothetical protein [Canibacter zhuwentaonis]